MKKNYVAPVVEKVTFDYKTQIITGSTECYESVMNTRVNGGSTCDEGTPINFGWTKEQTGF